MKHIKKKGEKDNLIKSIEKENGETEDFIQNILLLQLITSIPFPKNIQMNS